jgi:hypothetical protein
MRYIGLFIFCLIVAFGIPTSGHINAQSITSFTGANASSLVLKPRYPEPNEQVTITINDYSINTHGSSIQWFVDGVLEPSVSNQRSITFTSGDIGKSNTILARTTLPNGTKLDASTTIQPTRVDMLVEAETLTPTFYKGRPIPSSGSLVRVTAVPFLGEQKSPASYSYLWKVGDTVQTGGSQYGKNYTTFTSKFEKNVFVSVDVIDSTGNVVSSESIYVPISDPELYFYEINPLRGMAEQAMQSPFIFIGDEVQVRAEPYFISTNLLSQNPYQQWKLNGQTVSNPSTDPQEITLRKEGDSGSFSLEFHIRNLQQLLQGVKKTVTLTF